MLNLIPWCLVFEYLGGEDVARARMVSKENNPWKFSGKDQQDIVPTLIKRIEATEAGRQLLKLAAESPCSLPKVLCCVEQGAYLRYDGLYWKSLGEMKHLFRFYPNGEVLGFYTYYTPEEVWCWWHKERKEALFRVVLEEGTVAPVWVPQGSDFLRLEFTTVDHGIHYAFKVVKDGSIDFLRRDHRYHRHTAGKLSFTKMQP